MTYMNIIEKKLIVNEISLKKYFTYCKQVYQMNNLDKMMLNSKSEPKTKTNTIGKMLFTAASLTYRSINELNGTVFNEVFDFKNFPSCTNSVGLMSR